MKDIPYQQWPGANLDPKANDRDGNCRHGPVLIEAKPFVCRDPSTIPPRRFLCGNHYVRGYVSATIAPGGLGKSSLDLVEGISMASGHDLLNGGRTIAQRKVWLYNLEDPSDEIERRIAAVMLHYGVSANEIAGHLFVSSGYDQPCIIGEKMRENVTIQTPIVNAFIDEISRKGIDALIIDPFVSCHRMPENDNTAIDAVVKSWAQIGQKTQCAVELVHHVRKSSNGPAEFTIDDARGASSLINALRVSRVLNVMSKDEAKDAKITERQRPSYFRVDRGKVNILPPAEKATWRKFMSVRLGNATDEDPEDSIGVVIAWQMPSLFEGMATNDLYRVQKKISEGEWKKDPRANDWAGYAVAEVLGSDPEEDHDRIQKMLKTWTKNGTLKEVRKDDKTRHRKWFIEVGQWAT
jgi:hypothetical protein